MLDDLSSDGSFIANVPTVKHSFPFQPTCPPTAWTVEDTSPKPLTRSGREQQKISTDKRPSKLHHANKGRSVWAGTEPKPAELNDTGTDTKYYV